MDGNRVVNEGLDAVGGEARTQIVARGAIARERDEQMIDVPGIELRRGRERAAVQPGAITRRQ